MKVDVIINVYGKPWQTLCTLKSLMKMSGDHIDKIYMIEEKQQPYNDSVKFIMDEFDNIVHFIPQEYVFTKYSGGDMTIQNNRYVFRYQYGIENSDKKYVFITHNDILYSEDIIGNMLDGIKGHIGIGLVGQCWNCPAFKGGVCDGDRHMNYKPSYEDVIELTKIHTPARHTQHNRLINKINPMPLPECRLNEFACLIDRNVTINECFPNGNTPLFGSYDILDLGDAWFRSLFLKGYKFKNYDINRDAYHGYFASDAGYPTQLDQQKYIGSELVAKKYYEENFQ